MDSVSINIIVGSQLGIIIMPHQNKCDHCGNMWLMHMSLQHCNPCSKAACRNESLKNCEQSWDKATRTVKLSYTVFSDHEKPDTNL